jgi:outer membrane protein TolC
MTDGRSSRFSLWSRYARSALVITVCVAEARRVVMLNVRRWVVAALITLPLAACHGVDGPPGHYHPAPTPLDSPTLDPRLAPIAPPAPAPGDRPLPINLPTALQLSGARPIDVALASERVEVAAAQVDRASVLWLPTLLLGPDYFRHDGQIQDVAGHVISTSKSTFLLGGAPTAIFAVSDAIFAPLAARQVAHAREAEVQAARNDALLATAEAYFNVQQARGELAGALDSAHRAAEVAEKTEKLVKGGLAPEVELGRIRAEASRRRQATQDARERWRTTSAELSRVLRLEPGALVEPMEPPHLRVALIGLHASVDELIPLALTNRPELAARQALVQATLERLRQEKLRPLIPSVLLRGASTNPAGTLGFGYFGGGLNSDVRHFGSRMDLDLQVLWELQNLGFGNRARVRETGAENQLAVLEVFRVQDLIAAEVTQAHAQAVAAQARFADAEEGLKQAAESAIKSIEGMGQTRTIGGAIVLVIRPQEVVASVQALASAYSDYYRATADFSRAQFRLYRALGQPAQCIDVHPGPDAPPTLQRVPSTKKEKNQNKDEDAEKLPAPSREPDKKQP